MNPFKITAMKKLILLFTLTLIAASFNVVIANLTEESAESNRSVSNSELQVYCPDELTGITSKWAEEYSLSNPDINVSIINIENNKDYLKEGEFDIPLAIVTKDYLPDANREYYRIVVVGKDIFVPVININNPLSEKIINSGIKSNTLSKAITEKMNWNFLAGVDGDIPINFYVTNDASCNACVSDFLQTNRISAKGINMESKEELIGKIQNDPNAIAFVRLTDIIDAQTNSIIKDVMLLPVDKNENGTIDSFEDIYGDVNSFLRGVWIGKYPHQLVSNIYSVLKPQLADEGGDDFMKYILTDGQKELNTYGYCALVGSERQSNLAKIKEEPVIYDSTAPANAALKLIIALVIVAFLILAIFEISRRVQKIRAKSFVSHGYQKPEVLKEAALNIPEGLFYDKTHTWAYMEKDGIVKVGMDDFLPRVTGILTDVSMKTPGEKIKKGEVILSLIQNGKKLDIKAPVSGIIKENNKNLYNRASLINFSPYSDGWVYEIEPSNWIREIQLLFMSDKFKFWIKSEFTRLKDFIAMIQRIRDNSTNLILQEGGEIKDSVLLDLGPDVWEDFQSSFLDATS